MSHNPTIVVFDVGNVLIDWDHTRVYRKIFDDSDAMERFFDETDLMKWNLEQDRGRSWGDAETLLISDFPHYTDEIRAFRANWHDMISGEIEGTVALQQALLGAKVPLYAITNFAVDTFRESQQRFPFLRDFIDIVISGEEKLMKPEPEIYQRLLQRNNLDAADCLFIDDNKDNITTARAIGMHAHHFTSAANLKSELQHLDFSV